MFRHLVIGALVIGLLAGRVMAQDNQRHDIAALTLEAAVAEALERNPELRYLRSAHDADLELASHDAQSGPNRHVHVHGRAGIARQGQA
jgi:hypothetical protein